MFCNLVYRVFLMDKRLYNENNENLYKNFKFIDLDKVVDKDLDPHRKFNLYCSVSMKNKQYSYIFLLTDHFYKYLQDFMYLLNCTKDQYDAIFQHYYSSIPYLRSMGFNTILESEPEYEPISIKTPYAIDIDHLHCIPAEYFSPYIINRELIIDRTTIPLKTNNSLRTIGIEKYNSFRLYDLMEFIKQARLTWVNSGKPDYLSYLDDIDISLHDWLITRRDESNVVSIIKDNIQDEKFLKELDFIYNSKLNIEDYVLGKTFKGYSGLNLIKYNNWLVESYVDEYIHIMKWSIINE